MAVGGGFRDIFGVIRRWLAGGLGIGFRSTDDLIGEFIVDSDLEGYLITDESLTAQFAVLSSLLGEQNIDSDIDGQFVVLDVLYGDFIIEEDF